MNHPLLPQALFFLGPIYHSHEYLAHQGVPTRLLLEPPVKIKIRVNVRVVRGVSRFYKDLSARVHAAIPYPTGFYLSRSYLKFH